MTATDDDRGDSWSDEDQKSVVSVIYSCLIESPCTESPEEEGLFKHSRRGLPEFQEYPQVGYDSEDELSLRTGDDDVFVCDTEQTIVAPDLPPERQQTPAAASVRQGIDGDNDDDNDDDDNVDNDDDNNDNNNNDGVDMEVLTNAAVIIQARVRGFVVRKRLNEQKNGDGKQQ